VLQGEVNSVKNTAINTWLNGGVYWQWKKLHVSAYSGHHHVLITFLLKRVLYNMPKPRGDAEISSSF